MTKYIIKNCPAFDCKYNECHSKIGNHKLYCMDCTDCLIKQAIEIAKENICGNCGESECQRFKADCGYVKITKLFEIQELE